MGEALPAAGAQQDRPRRVRDAKSAGIKSHAPQFDDLGSTPVAPISASLGGTRNKSATARLVRHINSDNHRSALEKLIVSSIFLGQPINSKDELRREIDSQRYPPGRLFCPAFYRWAYFGDASTVGDVVQHYLSQRDLRAISTASLFDPEYISWESRFTRNIYSDDEVPIGGYLGYVLGHTDTPPNPTVSYLARLVGLSSGLSFKQYCRLCSLPLERIGVGVTSSSAVFSVGELIESLARDEVDDLYVERCHVFSTTSYRAESGIPPMKGGYFGHFIQHGRSEGRPTLTIKDLPRRVLDMVEEIMALDPHVSFPPNPVIAPYGRPRSADILEGFVKKLRRTASPRLAALIAVPWLKMGGADLVAVHFAIGYATHNTDATVALVVTDTPEETVFDFGVRLPPNIFVFNARAFRDVRSDDILDFLSTLLHLYPPRVYHIINSLVGYRYLDRIADEPRNFRVATNVFCFDVDPSGRLNGYIHDFVIPHLSVFDKIYSDNTAIVEEIARRYSLTEAERDRFQVLYNPIVRDIPRRAPVYGRASRFPKVLWIGRLDRQKRADILFEIARRERGALFDCYGAEVLETGVGLDPPHNVRLLGPLRALWTIRPGDYHAFLLTSEWEGLPNILLEVGSLGIPIIASIVGGVGDLISEATGWPVENFDDPDEYRFSLQAVLKHPDVAVEKAATLQRLIEDRHNLQAFLRGLSLRAEHRETSDA